MIRNRPPRASAQESCRLDMRHIGEGDKQKIEVSSRPDAGGQEWPMPSGDLDA